MSDFHITYNTSVVLSELTAIFSWKKYPRIGEYILSEKRDTKWKRKFFTHFRCRCLTDALFKGFGLNNSGMSVSPRWHNTRLGQSIAWYSFHFWYFCNFHIVRIGVSDCVEIECRSLIMCFYWLQWKPNVSPPYLQDWFWWIIFMITFYSVVNRK